MTLPAKNNRIFRASPLFILAALLAFGCAPGPHVLPSAQQKPLDRAVTEYPTGFALEPYVVGLDAPTGMCFDENGNLIIAEGGIDGAEPRIFGLHPDGTSFDIYPIGHRFPLFHYGYRIYGPVGGVLAYQGKIYVSHRDERNMGVITAFNYDGTHTTIVAGLPAQGDYSLTDLAISPINHRIYFGLGTATNSGVVGLDNWDAGWVRQYPQTCDVPNQPIKLPGYRFDAANPNASIFSRDVSVTVPFEPFGVSNITQIPASPYGKPTGAIYSVSTPGGGDLRVEAWGVHNPRGIAVNGAFGTIYFTDDGMELRGTRPIAGDPDALFRLIPGLWYGWPDFSRGLEPVSQQKFQPPGWMIINTGYPDVGFIIDHDASHLPAPDRRTIAGQFPSLAGAAKMDFVPESGPFRDYRGELIVALWGDRAPFATSGLPLKTPLPGYRVVRVDPDTGHVQDFIRNTEGGPASSLAAGSDVALERPIDIKFGPDGKLYILDYGYQRMKGAEPKTRDGSGKIYRLVPINPQ